MSDAEFLEQLATIVSVCGYAPAAPRIREIASRLTPEPSVEEAPKSHLEYCERCDGCGWYEGGPQMQTKCEVCNGTGVVRKPGR